MRPNTAQFGNVPRVLLADGDAATPGLVSAVISAECAMIATVYDGEAALDATLGLQPDVLVIDIALNGLDITRRLVAMNCATKLVILTTGEDPAHAAEARLAGAAAVVFKNRIKTDLPLAIREILKGRSFSSAAQ